MFLFICGIFLIFAYEEKYKFVRPNDGEHPSLQLEHTLILLTAPFTDNICVCVMAPEQHAFVLWKIGLLW